MRFGAVEVYFAEALGFWINQICFHGFSLGVCRRSASASGYFALLAEGLPLQCRCQGFGDISPNPASCSCSIVSRTSGRALCSRASARTSS